ncbi:MAG: SPOR domain-containing protein [Pseudorhodobacter sp.]
MKRARFKAILLAAATGIALAGCSSLPNPFGKERSPETESSMSMAGSRQLAEREVEAPEVFQVTDEALWDGRPSLGGIWVASPDATDPERVMLRNPANGRSVAGALFRRERINPGPPLQVSSEAAAALGILAGQPAQLNVTALRREEVSMDDPSLAPNTADGVGRSALDVPAVASTALDRVETITVTARMQAAPTFLNTPETQSHTQVKTRYGKVLWRDLAILDSLDTREEAVRNVKPMGHFNPHVLSH